MMMRTIALLVLASMATAATQTAPVWTFDGDRPGQPPERFVFAATRQDVPGAWMVRRRDQNGVLVHVPDPSRRGYALALAPGDPQHDLIVSARLRLEGGARAAGLVWRYQDAGNFYAAVLDLSRGALLLYLFRNGNRITVESRDGLELDGDAWHSLRVVHERTSVYVAIGGIRVFEERDGRLERTLGPGRAGVIATGDSDVSFDDLRVDPPRERRP